MAQHRPRKPASVEYTTDEEDTIVYDMGEEIESPKNGSTVGESKKDIAKYTSQLLPSTSSISTSNSESQPPIPTCNDAPSNMVTPIESSSSIIPTSSSQSVIQPPSDSNTVQDAKKIAKARSRKRKKNTEKK
ncbi:hypothetical protein TNCV_2620191 [Trichonephila clavipes]|uniref:Uncharacterized protein n=1 Tax=Trichonephila clavipes TaxID=2585209 RepID=A0A8X6WBD9_TRICX|nr:hypothetical protein TNCV_2620191 [Trichonephila clavipes]